MKGPAGITSSASRHISYDTTLIVRFRAQRCRQTTKTRTKGGLSVRRSHEMPLPLRLQPSTIMPSAGGHLATTISSLLTGKP